MSGAREPKRPYRKGDDVRADLLQATVDLLSERLPTDVSIRAIGDRAGLQHSLVNRHFGSKDQLVAVALSELTTRYAGIVADADDPVDGFLAALDHLRDNPTRALAMSADGSERTGDDAAAKFPGFNAHLAQFVAAGAPDDEHTRLVTAMVIALIAGWAFLEDTFLEAAGLDEVDDDEIRDRVAGIIGRLIERETGTTKR